MDEVLRYGVLFGVPAWIRVDARMRVAGLGLGRATDTFTNGRGRMHVRLLGVFTVVDADGPEIDQGSLTRWLNETIWFPQVWATDIFSWMPVDETSAVAVIESGQQRVEAEFRFDADGRIVDFLADRYREVGGEFVMTPWSTPITGYNNFDGMELPSAGSAVWALPNSDFEYIRIGITDIAHHTRT